MLYANDDFFAEKENLLKAGAPVFVEGKYTDRGKWMDGWESRRRRTPGFDWCVIRLGLPGRIRGVVVDTSFFRGNYPELCSIEACDLPGLPEVEYLISEQVEWVTILPPSQLQGDSRNDFTVSHGGASRTCGSRFTRTAGSRGCASTARSCPTGRGSRGAAKSISRRSSTAASSSPRATCSSATATT